MSAHRILAIPLVVAACSGCQTTIGNNLSNRARDFGECFRLQAGAGVASLKAGFSPGEFADFLLGWFGADIAGDDQALASSDSG